MTTYQIVDAAVADHPNLIRITRDLEAEALASIPGFHAWFDPSAQYIQRGAGFSWRDKITGDALVNFADNGPTADTINGLPALAFGAPSLPTSSTGSGSLIAQTGPALSGGDFCVSFVAKLLATASGRLFSSAVDTDFFQMGISSSNGTIAVATRVAQPVAARYNFDHRGANHVFTLAYREAGGVLTLRRNGALVEQVSGIIPPLPARIRFGGGGLTTTSQPLTGASVGHVMLFNQDLTAPGRGPDLNVVETYLRARAGV